MAWRRPLGRATLQQGGEIASLEGFEFSRSGFTPEAEIGVKPVAQTLQLHIVPAQGSVRIAAYLEAHIEQGPVLENVGKPIGIVTGVQGVRWFNVGIRGADQHAGTTPMNMRQDSFMAASRLVLPMRKFALNVSADTRFTVGRVEVLPGAVPVANLIRLVNGSESGEASAR